MADRYRFPALALAGINLAGCSVVKGVFKAGAWTGVILLVLAVAVVAGVVSLLRRAI